MPLFTDGLVSSIDDLTAQDSQLLEVASTEGIDVSRKLALAQDDLGVELMVLLNRLRFADQESWLVSPLYLAKVVVTPTLKMWHTYRALEMVYRDAYHSQLNDRYSGKRDQFHDLAQWACEKLIQTGIGIADQPVAKAAPPQVTAAAGGLPDGTYYVSVAWVNARNEEGASAEPAVIATSSSTLQVQPGDPPRNAIGWNVYIGNDSATMVLQNQAPIGPGERWLQPADLATAGRLAGTGQEPTYLKPIPRVIQRG